MSNRWLRFGIALLAIGAASAAGYRIYQQQQRLALSIERTRSADAAAETAVTTIPEIKAALHAYVAEGQGHAFWTARATMLLERLRSSMLELDGAATVAGVPITESLNLADRLAASEQRAREHVRAGQRLLAGEVIFTEARDLLDALRLQLARARTSIVEGEAAAQAQVRREQVVLALLSTGILSLAILLLVFPASGTPAVAATTIKAAAAHPPDEFESSARIISRTPLKPTTTPPGGTVRSSPTRASTDPNRFTRPCASTAGWSVTAAPMT